MQRYYGGKFTDWIAMLDMPYKYIDSCLTMLPIIRAEETQLALNVTMCGSGNAEKETANKFISRLSRVASARDPKKKPISSGMKNAALSRMGVAVIDMRDKNIDPKYKKKLFPFNPTK